MGHTLNINYVFSIEIVINYRCVLKTIMKKTYGISFETNLIKSVDEEGKIKGRSRSSMINKILMERYGAE